MSRLLTARGLFQRQLTDRKPVPGYVSEVLADTPKAYYRLGDPAGGIVADEIASPFQNGAVVGSITFGVPGALAYDTNSAVSGSSSANDYIQFPLFLDYETFDGLAVEFWFRNSTGGIPIRDLTSTGGTIPWWDNNGSLRVRLAGTDYDTAILSARFQSSTWRHYVAEYVDSGPTLNIYVDGELQHSQAISARLGQTTNGFNLFRNGTAGTGHGGGDVDELAFYDHPLGAERVAAHYEAAIN